MDDEVFFFYYLMILVSLYMKLKNKRRRRRRWGVRPLNRNRNERGMYGSLLRDMFEYDSEMFFKYTRMNKRIFVKLMQLVGSKLKKDARKNPIPSPQRLLITLHYLAEGCSMQELAWGHMIGKTTVSNIIKETVDALWSVLSPIYLKAPTQKDWELIGKDYSNTWNMPNCIGSLDGKHIETECPKGTGSLHYNYKKTFSIILMAICDASYNFIMVDVGGYGSQHDSTIFSQSEFGRCIIKNKINLPNATELPGTRIKFPYYFVADAAFPLHEVIMRPYPGQYLSNTKRIFNYRLSRARRTIENSFGILSQRWRILRRPIKANVDLCENITLACVALHNFIKSEEKDMAQDDRQYVPNGFVDSITSDGTIQNGNWRDEQHSTLQSVSRCGTNNSSAANRNLREMLANYFISPIGAIPWQENVLYRGALPDTFN